MDSKTKVDLVLNPLDYGGVVLKKGKFKLQFDEMLEYFLAIPNDDILYGLKRAGLAIRETSLAVGTATIKASILMNGMRSLMYSVSGFPYSAELIKSPAISA